MITSISKEYTGISLKAEVAKYIPTEDAKVEYIDMGTTPEELENFEIFDKDYVMTTCRSVDLGYVDVLLYEEDELLHHYSLELDLLPLQSQIIKINDVYYITICGFHNEIEFYQLNVLDQQVPTYSYPIGNAQQILTVVQNPLAQYMLCVATDDKKIHIIETVNMKELLQLDSTHVVQKLIFLQNQKDKFITCGIEDSHIYFYDFSVKIDGFVNQFDAQQNIEEMLLLDNNNLVVSCENGKTFLLDLNNQQVLKTITNNTSYLCLIQMGKLIIGCNPETQNIDILDLELNKIQQIDIKQVFSLQKHNQMIICGCGNNIIAAKNILKYLSQEQAKQYLDINETEYQTLIKQKEISKNIESYEGEDDKDDENDQ